MTQRLRIFTVGAKDIADYLNKHGVGDTTHTEVYDEAIQTMTQGLGFDIVIIDAVCGNEHALPLLKAMKQHLPRTHMPSVYVRHSSGSCLVAAEDGVTRDWNLGPSLQAHYPFAAFHQTNADEVPWLCEIIAKALPPVTTPSYH